MAESSSAPSLKARYHTINKLNGNNYQVWKLKMELYLKELQLWDVISTPALSPVAAEWTAKDSTAHMEIILHCGDRQVQMIRSLKSAPAIWSFFQKTYEHTNLVYQVSLIKRLVNTNMQEGQSATKFVDAWQALLDEVIISGTGHPGDITNHDFVGSLSILLAGIHHHTSLKCGSAAATLDGQNPPKRGSSQSIYGSPTSGTCHHYKAS
ncbi:hypothetical protein L7F22_035783 [Adiantum nelumboides]|nr:hypothetical protein [Adiantum nelumboides]